MRRVWQEFSRLNPYVYSAALRGGCCSVSIARFDVNPNKRRLLLLFSMWPIECMARTNALNDLECLFGLLRSFYLPYVVKLSMNLLTYSDAQSLCDS